MLPSERPVSKEHGLQTPCKPPVFNGEKGGPGGQNLYCSISTRPSNWHRPRNPSLPRWGSR